MIGVVRMMLAEIGEPETAIGIEDDVVRPRQRLPVAAIVQPLDPAGGKIDALDAAAAVIGGGIARDQHPGVGAAPFEAAVVADVQRAVGADRGTVGAAAGRRHHRRAAVGIDAADPSGGDLDDDHRAVAHPYRPFGKCQSVGD